MKYLLLYVAGSTVLFVGLVLVGARNADLVGMAACMWMVFCTWLVGLAIGFGTK